jgi:phosphoglycolate phosphatase
MQRLHEIAVDVAMRGGLDRSAAEAAVDSVWEPPDPVATAIPLADLVGLFGVLRDSGRRIAVVTADDRAPTLMTLSALGVARLVDAVRCADDGMPPKPAPETLLSVCIELGVAPESAAMVGDTPADLEMGRAAGAGAVIGVLSGAGDAEALGRDADVLIESIADLVPALAATSISLA